MLTILNKKREGEIEVPKYEVEYSSNNSGGSWWLEDEDWKALEEAGWDVAWYADRKDFFGGDYEGGRFLGGLAAEASIVVEADSVYDAEKKAVGMWESVTGMDYEDEGCSCCGPPHYISAYKLNQEIADA